MVCDGVLHQVSGRSDVPTVRGGLRQLSSLRPNAADVSLSSSGRQRVRTSVCACAAVLMFAYPAGKYPPFRQWSNLIVLPDSEFSTASSLSQLLNYDSLLIFALVLMLTSGAAREMLRPRLSSTTRVLIVVAVLFTAGGLVALPASNHMGLSFGRVLAHLTVILFAILLSRVELRATEVRILMAAAIAGTGLVMAGGLYAFYSSYGIPSSLFSVMFAHFDFTTSFYDYERFTYGNPAQTQEVIVLTMPLCFSMSLATGTRIFERTIYIVVGFLLLVNCVIAFERWALVVLSASLLLIMARLLYQGRKQALLIIGALIGALVVFVALPSIADGRVVLYFTRATQAGQADNLSDRISNWTHGIDAIRQNPWGVGFGTEIEQAGLPYGVAHNILIDTWIGGGPLAMAGAVVWLVWHLRGLLRHFWSAASRSPTLKSEATFGLYLGAFDLAFYAIFQAVPFYAYGIGVWMALWLVFPVLARALTDEGSNSNGPDSTARVHLPTTA